MMPAMDIPAVLSRQSLLTQTQIESLVMYQKVLSRDMTLKQAAQARTPSPVTVGAFYRSVQQGKRNLKASVTTLTLALWMGLVRSEELRKLLDQVGRGIPELEVSEVERLEAVIMALVDRIVM
jgi:hypothetical protein